jgi:hypothetical protein
MPSNVAKIRKKYNALVGKMDKKAHADEEEGNRSYGGAVRTAKGSLVEEIAKDLVEIAWDELGGDMIRISFLRENIRIPIKPDYLKRVRPPEVAEYIKTHIEQYHYGHKTDVHVSIDGRLVMGIECKAYAENAMLKRLLIDFTLLKQAAPGLKCVLLQLESQLSGDYSQPLKAVAYGSPSTHTLLSYFDVDLHIITLLEGERKVNKPIHKREHFKALTEPALRKAIDTLKDLLSEFVAQ